METSDKGTTANISIDHDAEHTKIIMEYERRLQELVRTHEEESYQLKQKHNDKIEELLQRITEINTRYVVSCYFYSILICICISLYSYSDY